MNRAEWLAEVERRKTENVRNRRHKRTTWRHRKLFLRDGNVCWLCGEILPRDPKRWSVDHYVARSAGGSHDLANLRLTHHHCNNIRGSAPPDVAPELVRAEIARRRMRDPSYGVITEQEVNVRSVAKNLTNDEGPINSGSAIPKRNT